MKGEPHRDPAQVPRVEPRARRRSSHSLISAGKASHPVPGANAGRLEVVSQEVPDHRRPPCRLSSPDLRRSHACYNPGVARVLMVSSEAAPLAKTGGLADVVGAL